MSLNLEIAVLLAMASTILTFVLSTLSCLTTPRTVATGLQVTWVDVYNPKVDLRKRMQKMQAKFSPNGFRVLVHKQAKNFYRIQFMYMLMETKPTDLAQRILTTLEPYMYDEHVDQETIVEILPPSGVTELTQAIAQIAFSLGSDLQGLIEIDTGQHIEKRSHSLGTRNGRQELRLTFPITNQQNIAHFAQELNDDWVDENCRLLTDALHVAEVKDLNVKNCLNLSRLGSIPKNNTARSAYISAADLPPVLSLISYDHTQYTSSHQRSNSSGYGLSDMHDSLPDISWNKRSPEQNFTPKDVEMAALQASPMHSSKLPEVLKKSVFEEIRFADSNLSESPTFTVSDSTMQIDPRSLPLSLTESDVRQIIITPDVYATPPVEES